jgi:hypothetical protein
MPSLGEPLLYLGISVAGAVIVRGLVPWGVQHFSLDDRVSTALFRISLSLSGVGALISGSLLKDVWRATNAPTGEGVKQPTPEAAPAKPVPAFPTPKWSGPSPPRWSLGSVHVLVDSCPMILHFDGRRRLPAQATGTGSPMPPGGPRRWP